MDGAAKAALSAVHKTQVNSINKCLLAYLRAASMELPASDAANAGAMVVHTTEDNPVSDGDPICELARGEREIGEEREGRERGKRGRRDQNDRTFC